MQVEGQIYWEAKSTIKCFGSTEPSSGLWGMILVLVNQGWMFENAKIHGQLFLDIQISPRFFIFLFLKGKLEAKYYFRECVYLRVCKQRAVFHLEIMLTTIYLLTNHIYIYIYIYITGFGIDNTQGLISHKTQPNQIAIRIKKISLIYSCHICRHRATKKKKVH